VAARECVFLAKATRLLAKGSLVFAAQMFEVQPDHTRVVEIGCEVLRRTGFVSAHPRHDIPHFGGEMIDVMPGRDGGVATAHRKSERLIGNHERQADERNSTRPFVRTQNAYSAGWLRSSSAWQPSAHEYHGLCVTLEWLNRAAALAKLGNSR
jgi:hypothetical protein